MKNLFITETTNMQKLPTSEQTPIHTISRNTDNSKMCGQHETTDDHPVNGISNPVPSNKQVTATEPRSATSIIKLPMPSEEAAAQMLIDTGSPTSECYVEPLQIQFDITPATN